MVIVILKMLIRPTYLALLPMAIWLRSIQQNLLKSSKIFYSPAIVIDVSAVSANIVGSGDKSIDLHQEYVNRFGTPAVRNSGTPAAIPTYGETKLY